MPGFLLVLIVSQYIKEFGTFLQSLADERYHAMNLMNPKRIQKLIFDSFFWFNFANGCGQYILPNLNFILQAINQNHLGYNFWGKNIAKKAAKTLVENEEDWGNLEKDGIAQ